MTNEDVLEIVFDTISGSYPEYSEDEDFRRRVGLKALEALASLEVAALSEEELLETTIDAVNQAIHCPEFAWRKCFEVFDGGIYRLYAGIRESEGRKYTSSDPTEESPQSFFRTGVAMVLSELEKPRDDRDLSRLEAGFLAMEGSVLRALRDSGSRNRLALRAILESHDHRFRYLTEAMWVDLYADVGRILLGVRPARLPHKRHRSKRSPSEREKRILSAIRRGLKGVRYCADLDEKGESPLQAWISEGCLSSHVDAYRDPKWAKRIQDEKCRVKSKFIQAERPQHRPTRHSATRRNE